MYDMRPEQKITSKRYLPAVAFRPPHVLRLLLQVVRNKTALRSRECVMSEKAVTVDGVRERGEHRTSSGSRIIGWEINGDGSGWIIAFQHL
jgi:hypothetical protein